MWNTPPDFPKLEVKLEYSTLIVSNYPNKNPPSSAWFASIIVYCIYTVGSIVLLSVIENKAPPYKVAELFVNVESLISIVYNW